MASETTMVIRTLQALESKVALSPLIMLPAEIRNQIYEMVLEDSPNHETVLLGRPFPSLPKLSLTCRAIQMDMMPMIFGRKQCILSLMIDRFPSRRPSFAALVHPVVENWMRRQVLDSGCIRSLQIQVGHPGALDCAFTLTIAKDAEQRRPVVEIERHPQERRSGPLSGCALRCLPMVFKARHCSPKFDGFMDEIKRVLETRLLTNGTGLIGVEDLDAIQGILAGCGRLV